MAILGLFIITIAKVLKIFLDAYSFVVLAAVIISWFRPDPYNPIVRFIVQITEPVFTAVRRRLPAVFFRTSIDFTPLIIFVLITVVDTFVVGSLWEFGWSLKQRYGAVPGILP